MKIKGVIWFTQGIGCFGIVYGETDVGNERKAYIGKVAGNDPKSDAEHIARTGTKLLPSQVKEISDYLNAN